MYESFYELKEKPFNLLPDPGYLYMSKGHENAYTHLEYAVYENKNFVVITGEIGSGKTTLINYLLNKIEQDIQVGLINNTYIPSEQFLKAICLEFELKVNGLDKTGMLDYFYRFLLRQFSDGKRVILIVDEAQNLSIKTLEEIRMLSNLETEKNHLIQMVVVGQPELRHKLQRKELEQLAQRVTSHCHLEGLKTNEVEQYIRYRLKVGGAGNHDIFDKEAIKIISQYSRGIPRLINIVCDTALVYGFADSLETIDKNVINRVIKEREGGRLLCRKPERSLSVPPIDAVNIEISESMIQSIEKRIRLLEHLVSNLNKNLNHLIKNKEERDTIVLDLFKMLKNSMESRWNFVKKFDSLKNHSQITPTKDIDPDPGRRSFFSESPRTRVLWILIAFAIAVVAIGVVDR